LIKRLVTHAGKTCVIGGLLVAIAIFGLSRVPTGFIPIEDQGYIIMNVMLPDGASLQRTEKVLDSLSTQISKVGGIENVISISGVSLLDNNASLANAGIILVVYGILGLLGIWFARKLDLPGIYREDGNWKRLFWVPLLIGVLCGFILVVGDLLFARFNDFGLFPNPGFPASILASISAGIGEEIAFRGFVLGLWAIILNFLLKRINGLNAALWLSNIIAALAFGAGHLGSLMILTGASTIMDISPILLIEIFLLNGIVGIAAGDRYIKDGLVAAVGVHFWTDIVFHVIWGVF